MLLEFDLSCVSLTAPTTVWLRFSSGTLPGQFKMTGLDTEAGGENDELDFEGAVTRCTKA